MELVTEREKKGSSKKISYERRDYESVDEKSLLRKNEFRKLRVKESENFQVCLIIFQREREIVSLHC